MARCSESGGSATKTLLASPWEMKGWADPRFGQTMAARDRDNVAGVHRELARRIKPCIVNAYAVPLAGDEGFRACVIRRSDDARGCADSRSQALQGYGIRIRFDS